MTTDTIQGNKLIAEFMGTEPEVEYCVGHKEKQTICYSPKKTDYFPSSGMQKAECERYLKEQRERYPNGWVTKEGYETLRYEWYPRYHASWDELMPVVEKIESQGCIVDMWLCLGRGGKIIKGSFKEPVQTIANTESNSFIEAVWTAILEYIKWYNEQKSNQ